MQPIVTHVACSVCLYVCVCLPVSHEPSVGPAKADEPIQILFGCAPCIRWGAESPHGKGYFLGWR